jgi:hypothetical protein
MNVPIESFLVQTPPRDDDAADALERSLVSLTFVGPNITSGRTAEEQYVDFLFALRTHPDLSRLGVWQQRDLKFTPRSELFVVCDSAELLLGEVCPGDEGLFSGISDMEKIYIAGGAVASVVFAVTLLYCCCWRNRDNRSKHEKDVEVLHAMKAGADSVLKRQHQAAEDKKHQVR